MKRIHGIELIIAAYFIAVMIYLNNAVDSAFWNSWYYLQYHIPIMALLIELIRTKKYDKYLLLSATVFNAEYAIFNIIIANKETNKYYELCTSQNFTLVFVVSLIALILIVNFAKRNGK